MLDDLTFHLKNGLRLMLSSVGFPCGVPLKRVSLFP